MREIELVIKISEEDYERLKVYKKAPFCSFPSRVYEAVANGTSLPEHHGRLIEDNVIADEFVCGKDDSYYQIISKWIKLQPTIIPATKNEFFNFDAPIIKKQTATKEGDGE